MEPKENFLTDLKNQVRDYVEARIKLAQLAVYEKVAGLFSSLIIATVVGLLLMMTYIFAGITAGFYFSELLGSNYQGFGIATLLNLLLLIIFLLIRKAVIKRRIMSSIIHTLTEKEEDNTNEAQERF